MVLPVSRPAVSGSFTVGALAVARAGANAVGAVRLTLLPDALEVELLKVGRFRESFAIGALTELVRFRIPFTAVRGVVRRGDVMWLTLDPFAVPSHNRFALSHFTDLPLDALGAVHRRVRALGLMSVGLPMAFGLLALVYVPAAMASGVLGQISFALLVTFLTGFSLRSALAAYRQNGLLGATLASAFEKRLLERTLAIPLAEIDTDWLAHPRDGTRDLIPTEEALPPLAPLVGAERRFRFAEHGKAFRRIALATAGILVATTATTVGVLTFRNIDASVPEETVAPLERSVDVAVPASASLPPALPSCACVRADSPLWRSGFPALTVIPMSKQRDEDGRVSADVGPTKRRRASRYDFDLAVVNNGKAALKDVRILLTFNRRGKNEERVGVTDRGLFWEGDLSAGRSVKWNVKAPGTEMKMEISEKEMLKDDDVAPPDAFRKLLSAQYPPVRLHGAMMLAYARDPAAREAAQGIADLSRPQEEMREQVVRATNDVFACEVTSKAGVLSACVWNAGKAAVGGVVLTEIVGARDGRKAAVREPIPAGEGRRVAVEGFGDAPEELGVVVE